MKLNCEEKNVIYVLLLLLFKKYVYPIGSDREVFARIPQTLAGRAKSKMRRRAPQGQIGQRTILRPTRE